MWNYRVVKKKHTYMLRESERISYTYGVYEAYYDSNNKVIVISQDPQDPFGENVEELRHSWIMMGEAFGQPILEFEKIPEEGSDDSIFSDKGFESDSSEDAIEAGIDAEKQQLGEQFAMPPFDHEEYAREQLVEMIKKEEEHMKFVGTPTLKELIDKCYQSYEDTKKKNKEEP